jgi:release factor glutamine methyltransferase
MRQIAVPAAGRHLTVADSRRVWATEFRAAGIDTAELDARVLVGHALGLDHAALAARAGQVLTPQ